MVPHNTIFKIDQGVKGIGYIRDLVVKGHLGKGQFGPVYKVWENQNRQVYALEMIDLKDYSPSALQSFNNEIKEKLDNQIVSGCVLQSYGIVNVGQLKFALLHEYVEGVLMPAWIKGNNKASWETKRHIFAQIVLGAYNAKKAGRLDDLLIPENILVTTDDQPKIIPLGIARYIVNDVFSEDYTRRITHSAPEFLFKVMGKEPEREKNIVFILGCLLYALIEGESYWLKTPSGEPDFNKMFHDGALKPSNILDTLHPDFSHRSEAAMKVLRNATVFDPGKRDLTIDGMMSLFEPIDNYKPPKKSAKAEYVKSAVEKQITDEPASETKNLQIPEQEAGTVKATPQNGSNRKWAYGLIAVFAIAGIFYFMKPSGNGEILPDEEKVAWDRALEKNTEYFYKKFASNFPDGDLAAQAVQLSSDIEPGEIKLNRLLKRRFTGKVSQFGDAQVLSVRFGTLETGPEVDRFTSTVNLGPVRKEMEGIIEKDKFTIRFIESAGSSKFNLQPGRIYEKNGKLMIESVVLDQYWILE